MAFGKNIAKSGAQAERIMSSKGLDSAPDHDPSQDTPVQASQAPDPGAQAPVNPFGGAAFQDQGNAPSEAAPARSSSNRPARPAPASRPVAFGRPQPPSRPAPGPASQANRPPRAPVSQRSGAPARPVQAPSPASAPTPRAAPVNASGAFGASAAAAEPVSSRAPEGLGDLFQGYTKMVAPTSRRDDGLPLRLERLIDEVSDFLGYDDARREEAKKRALTDTRAWDKKLTDYYVNTIRPHRARTAQTLEEARQKHPGKIVYLSVEGGEHSLKVFDRDSARGQQEALLDGATIETVSSSRTPFPAPKDVFGAADVSQKVDGDALDDAFSADSSPAPSKALRP